MEYRSRVYVILSEKLVYGGEVFGMIVIFGVS